LPLPVIENIFWGETYETEFDGIVGFVLFLVLSVQMLHQVLL